MSTAATATAPPIRPSSTLLGHLGGLRTRLVAQEFFRRFAVALIFAILFLGLEMLGDFFFEFPPEVRRVFLIIGGSIFAILFLRTLASLVTARRDEETLALMVEKTHPRFDSRLIASVQFAKGHASLPPDAAIHLVERTVTEAEDESKNARFGEAADPSAVRRALVSFTLIALIAGGAGYLARDVSPALVKRAFLIETPVPRDTYILNVTGDVRIGAGDPVELEATATGILPDTARLDIRYESGRRQSVTMGRDTEFTEEGRARYLASFEEVPESFTYVVIANDGRSRRHEVKAIERPRIEHLSGNQVYPEFTRLVTSEHLPGGFNLFPGSQFTLTATANKGLEGGVLRLIGQDEEIPLEVDPDDATKASAKFTVPSESLTGFTISLDGHEGMQSEDRTVYRVQLLTDNPPQVRITYPRRAEELATRRARFRVSFEATDRFGIRRADVNFKRGPDAEVETVPIPLDKEQPTEVVMDFDWIFSDLSPPPVEGDTIEFWVTATDLNDVAPGVGKSESLVVKIVSAAEKRADLLGRASDAIGTVGESTTDQEHINKELGDTIREESGIETPEIDPEAEKKLDPPADGSGN
jgi:hypothetical protein